MLSQKETEFMEYWETNRSKEKQTIRQLVIGLPVGLLFALPVFISYMTGWHKRAIMVGNASLNPIVLIIAVLAIACFVAVFSKKFKWDRLEQQYQELKNKADRLK